MPETSENGWILRPLTEFSRFLDDLLDDMRGIQAREQAFAEMIVRASIAPATI